MRRRFVLVITFASLVGLLAAIFVYRGVMHKVASEVGKQGTEEIVVAAVNMDLGEPVTTQHVKLASWPKLSIPADAIRSIAEAEGHVARTAIVAGEPLLASKILDIQVAARSGLLPMLVPEGLRGVTIKVDKAVEESGLVQPNSRVDVLVSLTRGSEEPMAKVILQNVPVLAAGQTVEMQDRKPVRITTVTLALTPGQAERLALAENSGRLMLATRNFRDQDRVETAGVTRARLLGESPSVPQPESTDARVAESPPRPQLDMYRVSVLRGGKVSEVNFTRVAGLWVAVSPR